MTMQGSTIMLVEDNPLTRKLVRTTLQREGCKLLEAPDAATALGLFDKKRPDLVLQDLVLPDLSGFELVQKLRAHPHGGSVPILAFTGLLSQSDEARVSAAGFDGVLTKPIEPSRLLQIVRGHLPQLQLPAVPFGGGKTLLVVDDDPLQLKLARFRLGRLGFEIRTAENGEEALEAARRDKPDAIVTDALMPKLDGFGLCLAMRDHPNLADVPIVLMTSSYVERGDRELARRAGANAFVLRTADLGDVITALHDIFGGHATTPPPPSEREATEEVESARALRNLRQLERQVALNSGLMQRCSTLAAELSVLSTVADALVNTRDIEGALFEILVNCLDVAGASRGAIYLCDAEGKLKVRAHHGYSSIANELDDFFGHREVLDCMTARGPILEVASLVDIGELSPNLGEGALLVPLSARGELMGTLLLDAPQRRPITEDWRAFAQAIGNQVSLALSLARAFAQVERSELRMRALMENAEDAIFVGSVDGVIVDVNHAGERLLGLSRDRILGRHFGEFREHDEDEEDVAPHPTRRAEGHIVRSDGTTVPVEYAGALVDAGPGERLFMAIVRDVSERNALAEQLRHAQ
ncbi:MAG TPA: response regulator, partial [Polyangiaceae bacterium]|nr:response regulator [Polyangiaceae bacterium]